MAHDNPDPNELTDEDRAFFAEDAAECALADRCAALRDRGYQPADAVVKMAVVGFATELWDRGFTTPMIRQALRTAIRDIGRYADWKPTSTGVQRHRG